MKRWYDSNWRLKNYLDKLPTLNNELYEKIVKDLMELVREEDPKAFDRFAAYYPLSEQKQRWYDLNPYCWILVNGLKHVSPQIIEKVVHYFESIL